MEDIRILGGLRMALYTTLFAQDLASFRGLSLEQEKSWRKEPRETLLQVRDALNWARDHAEFDYNGLLPDISHNNKVLHGFLSRLSVEIDRLVKDEHVA